MSLNVKNIKTESKFERPPSLDAGTYPGAPVQVIGLGLQEQRAWKGETKSPRQMLKITYELADEFMLDEEGKEDESRPRWVSEDFPLHSLEADLATSTKRYNAMDPTLEHGGDFSKLLGSPCLIVLSADPSKKDADVIYNNVKDVNAMRAKDAAKAAGLVNPTKVFDFYDPDFEVFQSLPEWIQNTIKEGLDYEGSTLEGLVNGGGGAEKKPAEEKENNGASEESGSDGDDW